MVKSFSRIPTIPRLQSPAEGADGECYSAGAATTPCSPTRSSKKSSCCGNSSTSGYSYSDDSLKGVAMGSAGPNMHVDPHRHLHEGSAQVTPRRRISSSSSQNGSSIPRPRTPSSIPSSTPGRRSGIPGSNTPGPMTPTRSGTCRSSSSLLTTCATPLSTRPSMDASMASEAHMATDSCYNMDVPPGLTVPTMVLPQRLMGSRSLHQQDRLVLNAQPAMNTADLLTDAGRLRASCAHGSPKESASNIQVAVRMRPLSDKERSRGDHEAWGIDEQHNVGHFKAGKFEAKYHYDTVFGPQSSNQEVFQQLVQPLLPPVLNGVSATVFAYGVTSSGKTHTMMGGARDTGVEPGLVPLVVQQLFELIRLREQQDAAQPNREHATTYVVKLSMMEIYNEVLNDLLDPINTNLKLREDAARGMVVVEQLCEEVVTSPEHALQCIARGDTYRKVSATAYNEDSSRSHTICRLLVESITTHPNAGGGSNSVVSTPRAGGIPCTPRTGRVRSAGPEHGSRTTTAVVNLIDLAGSESAKVSVSKGQRMEGSFINKSLLTLGTVINKLAAAAPAARQQQQQQQQHIPFRDSKLTRLLQASMTGTGARIAIVCNITPAAAQFEETNNTLKFATRAKLVRVAVSAQQTVDDHVLLRQYRRELKELRSQLAAVLAAQQPSQRQQYRDQYQQNGDVYDTGVVSAFATAGNGYEAGDMDACEQHSMGDSQDLAARLQHMTRLFHAERDARAKAEMEVTVLEARLNSLLRVVASDARKGLAVSHQHISLDSITKRDGHDFGGYHPRRDGNRHTKRRDVEASGLQHQCGWGSAAGARDAVPHACSSGCVPFTSQGGAMGQTQQPAIDHSGANDSPKPNTASSTNEPTPGKATPTRTSANGAMHTPRSAFRRRGTSESGRGCATPTGHVLALDPPLVSSISSTPACAANQSRSSPGDDHHQKSGSINKSADTHTSIRSHVCDISDAVSGHHLGSLHGDAADAGAHDASTAAAHASAATAAAGAAAAGVADVCAVVMERSRQNVGLGRQAVSQPASSRPSLAGFSALGTSRRSSESSYDVDAELALLEQIHQMQDDLHTNEHRQGLPGPCWLPEAPSMGSVTTSAVTTLTDMNSNPHNTTHHNMMSPRSGGSVLNDPDKDLEIQVLLADREVLQDQVVSVELANAALQQQAAKLEAQAARARKEAEKERTAKQQLECKMSELRAELEKLQVTVMHRQEQLQQQGVELGLE